MRHLAAIIMMLAALTMAAQTHHEGNLAVGGKGGVTLSRVNFNPSVPQVMLPGMTAGVMVRYIEENHFGLLAELNLEQRGWKESFEESDYRYQNRLTYLQLPIMTHIYFGNQRVKGFFNAGPSVSLMIADKASANFDVTSAAGLEYFNENSRHIEQYTLDIKNRFDYGLAAGVGMELNLTPRSSLLLEGRFYYGLNDIYSNHKSDTFCGSASMTILVTLGYMYRLR